MGLIVPSNRNFVYISVFRRLGAEDAGECHGRSMIAAFWGTVVASQTRVGKPLKARRRAFTLIELLVVIAILAMILGLAVAARQRAQETLAVKAVEDSPLD